MKIMDKYSRPLRDLRVSVTDRCNFRCNYCMPKSVFGKHHHFLSRTDLLSYEEIERLAKIFISLGVRKIRLTGGEPLLRHDLEHLIVKLSKLPDLKDLALTTNASLLSKRRVVLLKSSGIDRLNISLDALDEVTYKKINEVDCRIEDILNGIDNAINGGFSILKINVVVQKNINENQILPLVKYFRGKPVILRFIEFMDVGNVNHWSLSRVVTAKQIIHKINKQYPLEPVTSNFLGEVAKRWKYQDGAGEIGVISSISEPFCNDCSRVRLSAVGELYTCLFANQGFDLKQRLRQGYDNEQLKQDIIAIWSSRIDKYSALRRSSSVKGIKPKVEMSYIGG